MRAWVRGACSCARAVVRAVDVRGCRRHAADAHVRCRRFQIHDRVDVPPAWVWQNGGVVDGGWGGARRLEAAGGGVEGSGF